MKELIKHIREYMGLSQTDLARQLDVTFATINRWENGRAFPARIAQAKLYELCKKASVPLYNMVLEQIRQNTDLISQNSDRLVLYHGSKRGIEGTIEPKSRSKCDFGKGFYMGSDPAQSLTLICGFEKSKFYIVSLDLSAVKSVELPVDIEWAMTVAYYRGKMDRIKGTRLYNKYAAIAKKADVMIGSIANDRIFFVLDNFFQGNISDVALIHSLAALNLGKQYVAITPQGCNAVKIEQEIPISYLERLCLLEESERNRVKGIELGNSICRNYRHEGKFFDEILDEATGEKA